MTEEEAQEMIRKLEQHYAEPVMPVSFYCDAFRTYAGCLRDKIKRLKDGPGTTNESDNSIYNRNREAKRLSERYVELTSIMINISKSNLLARLIYGKEPVRTEMCPKHKGNWSGLAEMVNCKHGCDGTGWLPAEGHHADPTSLPGPRFVVLTPAVPPRKK